jgi:urea transporter/murein DD-endopeptidase MepM/ murein hydrolase activator NlpD
MKLQKFIHEVSGALINSYSSLFFSNNPWMGTIILVISFFNPEAGLAGLASCMVSIMLARMAHLHQDAVISGFLNYNSLLLGIGLGTFYDLNAALWLLIVAGSALTLFLTIGFWGIFRKYGLPVLSIPFILTFWIIMLSTREFSFIAVSTKNIYWLNEMYAAGGNDLIHFFEFFENNTLPHTVNTYLRAMSAVVFQNNIFAGILLSIGLFIYSRIAFSLSILAYLSLMIFSKVTGAYAEGINYYHLGTNFMMMAIASGGFFTIPSAASYLWSLLCIPIAAILVSGLSQWLLPFSLPVFSLPFCIIIWTFLFFLMNRTKEKFLFLTRIQLFSPEKNLYAFTNGKQRLSGRNFFPFQLPFLGNWVVSQGYDGKITHKGEWSKALDFVVLDEEMKTYKNNGMLCEDYHCYGKPVLAPADAYVVETIDYIEDNPIGTVDTKLNWGNTIVLNHLPGLYTKFSHLQKFSIKVKKGDYIKKGDLMALVGNSGRSPEPHLHFQVQTTPFIGAKTLACPFSVFKNQLNKNIEVFSTPAEGNIIANPEICHPIREALRFQPGWVGKFLVRDEKDSTWEETWECSTDAYNQTYLFCKEKNATAYFQSGDAEFLFLSFYGNKKSLLHLFFLGAFRILPFFEPTLKVKDILPLHYVKPGPLLWIQDFIAPFFRFLIPEFEVSYRYRNDAYYPTRVLLESQISLRGNKQCLQKTKIEFADNHLLSIEVQKSNGNLWKGKWLA